MAPQRNAGADMEAELPEYAGHYRLESCLGSGGMGVVHLARSTSGMRLAVKVVHAEFARDPEFRGRFRQEVAAARRVSGAFTAPVVDADPDAGRPWMATTFIAGPTLAEQVKRNGPLDTGQLRRLMAGLAEALRDIHRVGVVHRDLKPSNVLLAEDGPKVIDFGISRPADSELRTETGKLIGTPPFMAPEQFRRPREVGPAADVFALGSVTVHAATGRGPFDSDSPYVVAYQVVHDEPDLTGVPEPLAGLVRRCLAKAPEDRPTPDELMRELRSVAASYDTQAFIPAQRAGGAPVGREAREADGGGESWAGPEPVFEPDPRPAAGPHRSSAPWSAPDPQPEPAVASRPGRGPGRRVRLAAGALGLAVCAALVSFTAFGGEGEAPRKASSGGVPGPWTARPVSARGGVPQCAHGARALLCAQPGVVFALDPADGELRWRRSVATDSVGGPPVLSGGLVQPFPDGGPRLEGRSPATGERVWERGGSGSRSIRYAGDTLLLVGADGTVTGVDSASGRTAWTKSAAVPVDAALDSFPGDPLAYATAPAPDGSGTRVTALDPGTGEVRWSARLAGTLRPVGAGKGSVDFLAVDGPESRAVAVVRYTPGTRTTSRVELSVPRPDVRASVRGDVAYLLAADGALQAVDLDARAELWHLETSVPHGSAPAADARHVYVTAPDGRLLAVDARDGRLVGQTPARLGPDAGEVAAALPSPVAVGGLVYAGAPDGTVFAVAGGDPAAW
ncbi:PQQ-binding-like beta-propeller repeat protein [Streptomyces sp. NPDC000134]|uniref:serine/threonine-protein kinase n=1 Tax=Streptomyces sp. NPDC000134 TaxID=3364536 RepID=UPI0036C07BEA